MKYQVQDKSQIRILILTFTPIKSEPRALKQIRHLSTEYSVTSAGFGGQAVEGVAHIELDSRPPVTVLKRFLMLVGFVLRFYRFSTLQAPVEKSARARLSAQDWDVIIAHDVSTIPLARSLAPKFGVLADLHEYAPRQGEDSLLWRIFIAPYFRWVLRNHVSRCQEITTVGEGIVNEYRKNYGFESTLVVNATPFKNLKPTPTTNPIKLVHSGIPSPARKLEVMIDAVKSTTADVILDLYLMQSNTQYIEFLKKRIGNDHRIRILPPVPYSKLIDTLHKYDVGISMIAPTTFNLAWCLPNKFFDFIQARLALVIGPSPEMVTFVEKFGLGVVANDFSAESLKNAIDSLSPSKVDEFKSAADRSAEVLSGERQSEIWVQVVDRMVSK